MQSYDYLSPLRRGRKGSVVDGGLRPGRNLILHPGGRRHIMIGAIVTVVTRVIEFFGISEADDLW